MLFDEYQGASISAKADKKSSQQQSLLLKLTHPKSAVKNHINKTTASVTNRQVCFGCLIVSLSCLSFLPVLAWLSYTINFFGADLGSMFLNILFH